MASLLNTSLSPEHVQSPQPGCFQSGVFLVFMIKRYVRVLILENLGDKVSWCQLSSVRWELVTGSGQLCETSFPESRRIIMALTSVMTVLSCSVPVSLWGSLCSHSCIEGDASVTSLEGLTVACLASGIVTTERRILMIWEIYTHRGQADYS